MSLTKVSYSMIQGASINVLDYGVIADGVTNSGAAMQSAFNAANNQNIVIPPGSYNIGNTQLQISANVNVFAYGATLSWSDDVTGITFAASDTYQGGWFGGKLVGHSSATQINTGIAIKCEGTVGTYAIAPKIEDVWIDNWSFYGVNFSFTKNGRVLNNKITNIAYAGVAGLSCEDMKVDGNYIGQIGTGTPGENAYGSFIDRLNGTLVQYPLSKNCSMSFNTVEDIPTWHGLDTHAGQYFVFEGNVIRNCKRGINVTSSRNGSNLEQWSPVHCVVSGNTIDCLYTGQAINLVGAYESGAVVSYANQCIIANNTIQGGGIDGGGNYEGAIKVHTTYGCKIVNNALYRPAAAGISIYHDNIAIDVSGNTIANVGDSTDSVVSCISVPSNNNTGNVNNNTFLADETWATYNSVLSIYMSSGITGSNLNFGLSKFYGISTTTLNAQFNTLSAANASQFYTENNDTALSGGTVTVSFNNRFPKTPKVFVTNTSDTNPIRISSVSQTGFTAVGTGTTNFSWYATT